MTSPYLRAQRTAAAIAAARGPSAVLRFDERLREKELCSLDRQTRTGILRRFPGEAELRPRLGKFYYRPPGGESWCDVLLRVRAVIDHLRLVRREQRVVLVAHQVIVSCARVALEHLDETAILDIDARGEVFNCGVTSYVASDGGELALDQYNLAIPLLEHDAPITTEPDPGEGGP